MTVYIAHAPADRDSAEQLEKLMERRGHFVELDDGEVALAPVGAADVVALLVSARLSGAEQRLRLEQRALDAWCSDRLVLARLDEAPAPLGLRDLPMIEARDEEGWRAVAEAIVRAPRAQPAAARARKGWLDALKPRPAFFVSFAPDNAPLVTPLIDAAKRQAKRGFQTGGGDPRAAIGAAAGVLVVCSRAAFESDSVKRDLFLADRLGKRLAPVLIEDAAAPEDFRYFLAGAPMFNLFETPEPERPRALARLLGSQA